MLTSVSTINLQSYQYSIQGISNLSEFKIFIEQWISDPLFWEEFITMLTARKHLMETFHSRNISDVVSSFKSALVSMSKVNGIHELVSLIFSIMNTLSIDLFSKEGKFIKSSVFLVKYLDDSTIARALGVRRLTHVCKERGLITTSGDDASPKMVYMFKVFVEGGYSIIPLINKRIEATFVAGNPLLIIEVSLSPEMFLSLYDFLTNSDSISNTNNKFMRKVTNVKKKSTSHNGVSTDSRLFSTLVTPNRTNLVSRVLVFKHNTVRTIYLPKRLKLTDDIFKYIGKHLKLL
jgi:hypothetical protein